MACKLNLAGQRLPFLWNVSNKVGDSKTCPNGRSDVELVSYMLEFIISRQARRPKVNVPINGDFDVPTAFHIYTLQADRKYTIPKYRSCEVDGIISPARHFDDVKWTIVYMNAVMFNTSKETFMNLANDSRLSVILRAELSGASSQIR